MGNDSSYTIKLSGSSDQIAAVAEYIAEKTRRWEAWDAKTKSWDAEKRAEARVDEMKKLGLRKRADFVTWGFIVEDLETEDGLGTITLSGWANENSSNCHISGEDGELAVLHARFPSLDYSVDYRDDYSQGYCLPPFFDKQEDEEAGGTLEQQEAEFFLRGGEEGLMEWAGTETNDYKYLGEGVAVLLSQRLDRNIDLSGVEWLGEDEAMALARLPKDRVKLNASVEKLVKSHRRDRSTRADDGKGKKGKKKARTRRR